MENSKNYPQPFLKWVGGKRQIIDVIKKRMPEKFNDYYEPFVGGGAVFFNINANNNIYINDINTQLINVYQQIKYNPIDLMLCIDEINLPKVNLDRYIFLREKFNEKIINANLDVDMAALFMVINKYCFNGIYRVNKKGLYNVPWNKKETSIIYEKENILAVHNKLKETKICNGDFEVVLQTAKKGDFIFLDSPYAPLNDNSFDAYTKTGFLEADHIRLANEFARLDKIGCYVMLTNHNTELIRNLYKNYKIEEITVKRLVNSDAKNRIGREIIITNY